MQKWQISNILVSIKSGCKRATVTYSKKISFESRHYLPDVGKGWRTFFFNSESKMSLGKITYGNNKRNGYNLA